MNSSTYTRFLCYLQDELAVPASAIAFVRRQYEEKTGPLPMILWQYGLVTLEQLDKIFDWLEAA